MSHDPDSVENIFTERTLGAHRLAQYVSRNRCERYLRLALFPSEAKGIAARYRVGFENLSPLLSESGQRFERDQIAELSARADVRNLQNTSAAAFVSALKSQGAGRRTFYYQARLEGRIGGCNCEGYPDLIEIERHDDDGREGGGDTVDVTVIDIKASRRETVGFRLQVAFYARLLGDALRAAGLKPATFKGAIAARNSELAPDRIERFDLSLYLDEIEQLVAAADSDVARASARSFTDAAYHLGAHCDGCPYNALCFIDTAEREDLSLIPSLTATEKGALHSVGVRTTRELARLLDYGKGAMLPAPGREKDVERIGARWPLGSRLPVLAQRARAALRRLDRDVEAKRYTLGADWGSLPDEGQYPNLIKVYVDAERDHLEDKVYLLAGIVAGPSGSIEIVENTLTKPDATSERALLVAWVARLLPAIARAADANSAPVHVYLYDRRGQRALLEALARHFAALCALPAFYDLLTSTPALTQGMISFLAEEVSERLNLGAVCQNLYEVAREMGFKWRDEERELNKTFRARIFDNARAFTRDAETGELVAASTEDKAGRAMWVESAARFGTEIPLEYAYAAWGLLKESPEMQAQERTQVRGFLGTTIEDVRALAVERCRALRFIEESFKYKNRQVEKEPLSLAHLDRTELDADGVALHRALEDFLYLEHHAKMQELLLHLSLPPDGRAAGGRTLVVRCASYERAEDGEDRAEFNFSKTDGEVSTVTDMAALRFREGDWVVLNPLLGETGAFLPARKLVRGRLAVVEALDDARVSLRLLSMNFKNSNFRYPHWSFKPEAGAVCTIDAMADDLNADKFLDACRHAASNHLYHWLTNAEEAKRGRAIRPKRLRDAAEIAAHASRAQAPHGLTGAQARVVGGYLQERVLVLQGPPGTGKSHTLGFAVLARALALATPARPFRVAVAAKTHAASSIALASIARGARQLLQAGTGDARLAPLERLRVAKICNDAGEALAEGVERLFADGGEELSAGGQWAMLLGEPLLVVGGTPGGIYNLIKKGASKGKAIDWTQELFDLVIVDEASQMGIAEALTAAAFLRGDGQFIAIGDHRQMPPILAHAWDRESRRDLKHAQPHLSIFETLRALGFTSEALDQSFRIPAEIAGFLQRHIYAGDGINFRSDNRARMAADDALDGWLGAAFTPEHSLVVIEHDESGSQQSNEFEAALVEALAGVACEKLGCGGEGGIGVVVPHRAQKALLRARLPRLANSIDTVERFQGGERELIILSATVSDREFARAESGFLLEPRRLTVAISRPKRKLIVIASRAVFDLIPADLDEYERGALWKYLRHECGRTTLWEGEIEGHRVRVRTLCEG
ncbi:MAG TPA: AAA domain-containing protein [Pyrinomonadaceae bacterium]|nr:AAA domain-containing protein [Pyrinomonadaceae bacterium]